ncbi:MAG: glycosyltransferase WbuB, partial [Ignavibacteria bacterium]|nr:glycosyltransferase WbuB [Ignavibacteria bacterium]
MAGKRILIFTNHFYPENFKVNDVAFELVKNNFEVTVLTGIPNYPQGKFYKGYGLIKKRKE